MAISEPLRTAREAEEAEEIPLLENGDHLDQPTFHALYEAMPEQVRAELIGGVVIMPSPMATPHGRYGRRLSHLLQSYSDATPGTDGGDNATVILGDDSEPQPDCFLAIVGGQTRLDEKEYLVGPPELVAEVASSTAAYDLHSKKRDYERWGVQEYVVFVVRQKKVVWFAREDDRFVEMPPDGDGVLQSRVFPGLWLDPEAFFRLDAARLNSVLDAGLRSDAHREFVERLARRPEA